MAEQVDGGDGEERAEEVRGYLRLLDAEGIEGEGEEADGDVEGFARDFVFMDEVAVVAVEGDEA